MKVKTEPEPEPVETDEAEPLEDIPDFLTAKGADPKPESHISVDDLTDLVSMCLSIVVYVHDSLVLVTDYEGFALDEADQTLWRTTLKFLLKDVDIKYLPQIIAMVGLVMMESMKVFGYMKWKKGQAIAQPATEKKGFIDAPTS